MNKTTIMCKNARQSWRSEIAFAPPKSFVRGSFAMQCIVTFFTDGYKQRDVGILGVDLPQEDEIRKEWSIPFDRPKITPLFLRTVTDKQPLSWIAAILIADGHLEALNAGISVSYGAEIKSDDEAISLPLLM
ncbi:MAG: hypothetical protein H6650_20470 [Ardenticatenales bacterium]|nr:hypothetical protein [Ardenticatenales bacterium]